MDNVTAIIIAIVTAAGTFIAGRATSKANSNAVDVETFQKLVDKVGKLSDDLNLVKSSNTALWSYVYDLIEFIMEKGHIPPPPPAELDTNPRLIKLLNNMPKEKK